MQLYLIRHGQSTNNVSWEFRDTDGYDRVSDPPLTELGIRQAQALATYITATQSIPDKNISVGTYRNSVSLTHLYSSLMIRAIQTGTVLSDSLGIPLYGLPDVHEIGGIYLETLVDGKTEISFEHGVTPAYLQENFPAFKLHQPIEETGWWQGGQEPADAPLARANRVLQFLLTKHLGTNDHVAVVTHGGFFNTLVRAIFSIRPDEPDNRNLPIWFSFCNCAISRFDFGNDRVIFTYHNRTDYFPEELVTC